MHVSSSRDFSGGVRVGRKTAHVEWKSMAAFSRTPLLTLKAWQGEHSAAPASCQGGTAELTGPS